MTKITTHLHKKNTYSCEPISVQVFLPQQKLGEQARDTLSLGVPSRNQTWGHHDFRHPALRTVSKYISMFKSSGPRESVTIANASHRDPEELGL